MTVTPPATAIGSDSVVHGLSAFLDRHSGKTLVLLAQDLAHWYVGEVAAGANQAALSHGFYLITLDFHRSADRERELLQAICEAQVQGCIFLWDHSPLNLDLYARVAAKCACVQLGDRKPIPQLDYISSDDYSGALAAVRHLIYLGYRQIGHLTLRSSMEAVSDRRQAYLDALKQAGLPVNEQWILAVPYGLTDADRTRRLPEIRKFLTQPQLPRALFICADWLASEVIECIQDLGLSVPDDIALVGYDDALPYALTRIPLTTVRVDLRQSGRLAVERLLFRLRNATQQIEPCQILTPPMLVVRASSVQLTPTTERWDFVVRYIQDHFRDDLSVQQVAGMLGLDANYFSHQFRRVFGKRFTDHVNQLRLQYACQLLLTTDGTIDNVAESAGFQSSNHFYALFKRSYRVSPHAYRKQQTFR